MDIFTNALQFKVDKESLYTALAKKTEDKNLRKIFRLLAEDEGKHYGVISNMRKTLDLKIQETTVLKNAKNIFQEAKDNNEFFTSHGNISEMLTQAMDLEKQSQVFFLQHADKLPKDAQKDLFLKIAAEEQKHCFLIENLMQFLAQPMSWLSNSKFNQLDV